MKPVWSIRWLLCRIRTGRMRWPFPTCPASATISRPRRLPGALPLGRNSPQRPAYGLYAEQLSGSPFTAPRGTNERSWLYRIRPSVKHTGRFKAAELSPVEDARPMSATMNWRSASFAGTRCRCRRSRPTFIAGMRTMTTAGDVLGQTGMAAHVYVANARWSTTISSMPTANCSSCRRSARCASSPRWASSSFGPARSASCRAA